MPHISSLLSLDSPPKRRTLLIAGFFLSLTACSETSPKGVPKADSPANVNETQPPADGQPANTPPIATIAIISPSSGDIPLTVTLSALESSDAEDSTEQLVAREGDERGPCFKCLPYAGFVGEPGRWRPIEPGTRRVKQPRAQIDEKRRSQIHKLIDRC